jgi:hypothetical protein
VIVHDLNCLCRTIYPFEDNPPLLVDADTLESQPGSLTVFPVYYQVEIANRPRWLPH